AGRPRRRRRRRDRLPGAAGPDRGRLPDDLRRGGGLARPHRPSELRAAPGRQGDVVGGRAGAGADPALRRPHRPLPRQRRQPPLLAGFAEADITPKLGGKPVYLAGFGHDRKATDVLDPIAVRAVVLRHGGQTVAVACADVVGLFLPSVERVRKELPGFTYVLV